jgi:hypothetical protein
MPAECYTCAEWGCSDEDGNPIPFMEGRVIECACDCHSWLDKVSEAADEIERLRTQIAEQTIIHEVQKTNTLNEMERLRAALALAVNELSRHGQYSVYSSEQLMQQFLEEARDA